LFRVLYRSLEVVFSWRVGSPLLTALPFLAHLLKEGDISSSAPEMAEMPEATEEVMDDVAYEALVEAPYAN
jgi:hypothetical protein